MRKISGYRNERENDQNVNNTNSTKNLWDFHDNLIIRNKEMAGTESDNLSLELKQYLHQPVIKRSENVFKYWDSLKHAFPTSTLALQFLSIISTSVPCERLFSHAGNVKTDNRSRLTKMVSISTFYCF